MFLNLPLLALRPDHDRGVNRMEMMFNDFSKQTQSSVTPFRSWGK